MRSAGLPIGHVPRTLAGYFRSVLEDGCVFAEVTGDPIPSLNVGRFGHGRFGQDVLARTFWPRTFWPHIVKKWTFWPK